MLGVELLGVALSRNLIPAIAAAATAMATALFYLLADLYQVSIGSVEMGLWMGRCLPAHTLFQEFFYFLVCEEPEKPWPCGRKQQLLHRNAPKTETLMWACKMAYSQAFNLALRSCSGRPFLFPLSLSATFLALDRNRKRAKSGQVCCRQADRREEREREKE